MNRIWFLTRLGKLRQFIATFRLAWRRKPNLFKDFMGIVGLQNPTYNRSCPRPFRISIDNSKPEKCEIPASQRKHWLKRYGQAARLPACPESGVLLPIPIAVLKDRFWPRKASWNIVWAIPEILFPLQRQRVPSAKRQKRPTKRLHWSLIPLRQRCEPVPSPVSPPQQKCAGCATVTLSRGQRPWLASSCPVSGRWESSLSTPERWLSSLWLACRLHLAKTDETGSYSPVRMSNTAN